MMSYKSKTCAHQATWYNHSKGDYSTSKAYSTKGVCCGAIKFGARCSDCPEN